MEKLLPGGLDCGGQVSEIVPVDAAIVLHGGCDIIAYNLYQLRRHNHHLHCRFRYYFLDHYDP